MSFDKSNALDRSGSDRPDGYYWVKIGTMWRISEWDGNWFPSYGGMMFSEIHGPIRPPDYGKALEEWGPEHTQHISDTQ